MNKIILDQNNLKGFFSPVGPLHSHHEEHIWPYDYVDRDSDTLLVTIGDSWTWGSGLNDPPIDATDTTVEARKIRQDKLFGNLISKEKNFNWLNLSFYAMGNQWICNKVFELRALIPFLPFKKIIVMCVMTATGRWFNTWQDSLVDYKKFFEVNKMTDPADFEKFFSDLNRKVLNEIQLLLRTADHTELLVGSNMVDHCGFDVLDSKCVITLPWYKLLTTTDLGGISVDYDSIKHLTRIETLLWNNDQRPAFQKWMNKKIKEAEQQRIMVNNMDDLCADGFHPNQNGHKKWANYILEQVI